MGKIPVAQGLASSPQRIRQNVELKNNENIVFSFNAIEKNEYFNLDSTCQNWAQDLFDTMKIVSNISIREVYSGMYSRDGSTLRIHSHENATCPCKLPSSVNLEDMWQIRISKSKGGIHGVFYENIFYVIWFDPLHNLYPDDRYGGLRKIKPPTTCCMERDEVLNQLRAELGKNKEYIEYLEECVDKCEKKMKENNMDLSY